MSSPAGLVEQGIAACAAVDLDALTDGELHELTALRRAIEVRDLRCQHPSGCDEPAEHCDVDHITPAAQGGITSQGNGRIECKPHNRSPRKHDHGAQPRPDRPIDTLAILRARIRRRMRRDHPDELIDPDLWDDPDVADTA